MKVRYLPDTREWLIDSNWHTFSIQLFRGKYALSEIREPDKELMYVSEYDHLGSALEIIIRNEMEENA